MDQLLQPLSVVEARELLGKHKQLGVSKQLYNLLIIFLENGGKDKNLGRFLATRINETKGAVLSTLLTTQRDGAQTSRSLIVSEREKQEMTAWKKFEGVVMRYTATLSPRMDYDFRLLEKNFSIYELDAAKLFLNERVGALVDINNDLVWESVISSLPKPVVESVVTDLTFSFRCQPGDFGIREGGSGIIMLRVDINAGDYHYNTFFLPLEGPSVLAGIMEQRGVTSYCELLDIDESFGGDW